MEQQKNEMWYTMLYAFVISQFLLQEPTKKSTYLYI
jgi:hypothetical protein